MYPNYPDVIDVNGEAEEVSIPDIILPEYKELPTNALSEGPRELGDSGGFLVNRWWLVEYNGNDVTIKSSNLEEWNTPTVVFTPTEPVVELDLTFDQLGNPVVFYLNTSGNLVLYYFNSLEGSYEELNLGEGSSPICMVDNPTNTSLSNTDVMIFYVREHKAYTRVQRERYLDEHYMGLERPDLKLLTAGFNRSNRVQIEYEFDKGGVIRFPYTVPIKNSGAEEGILHWVHEEGNLLVRTANPEPHSGTGYWYSNTLNMRYSQRIEDSTTSSRLREGSKALLSWWQSSYAGLDRAGCGLRFYDINGDLLSEEIPDLVNSVREVWILREHEFSIPEGSHSMDVVILGNRVAGNNSDGYLDDVKVILEK